MPKATEIPLKECSAYGQIDQGGGERENYIYEHPTVMADITLIS